MSDSEEKISDKRSPETHQLFENTFIYVTESGDLYLKKTRYFDERKVASIDPGAGVEEQITRYRENFTRLEEKADEKITEWAGVDPDSASFGEMGEDYKSLREEILNADAAGDFEALLNRLDEAWLQVKAESSSGAEAEEEPVAGTKAGAEESMEAGEGAEEQEARSEEEEAADSESPVVRTEAEGQVGAKDSDAAEESEAAESEAAEESEVGKSDAAEESEVGKSGAAEESEAGKSGAADSEAGKSGAADSEAEEGPEAYYRKLAEKAESLIELTDWPYVTMEFADLEKLWSEGPDTEDIDTGPYRERIEKALETFEEKKEAHYKEQERIREENLVKKNELMNELKRIVDEGAWTATREVGRIRNKWDQLKPLPSGKAEELQPEFNRLLKVFDDHKVDRIVKKKQKEEENLAGKLMLLDKMGELLKSVDSEEADWESAEKKLEKLNKQWRKIGRVPSEKNQETWDQYHHVQDQYHQLRFKHDKKYRKQIEKFLSKKKQLVKEAESLMDHDDLAEAARKVNKLHRRWKKIGNLPQKDENELWDQFKHATDAFNDKKSANIDQLREQEEKNLEEKQKLIKVAEELNDSEEWDETHDRYQKLMEQWKQAGPVPKKMSGKVWKKFKQAMDTFYDRRRDHFKQIKKERKGNLEEKQEVLEKLKSLTTHENPIQAVEEAKSLQEDFKKAGYVPIKFKNKMWKEYRETCDIIYDRYRAAKSAANVVGKENVGDFSTDDIAEIQKKQKEAEKLRKEVNKLHSEMIQMKESLSYFKPSGKGSSLLDQVHEKLEKAELKIEKKEERLEGIEKEIDQMRRSAE